MKNDKLIHMVAFILAMVGALNWGLIGLFGYNLVSSLFGSMPQVENLIYILVGVSAVVLVVTHQKSCRYCGSK